MWVRRRGSGWRRGLGIGRGMSVFSWERGVCADVRCALGRQKKEQGTGEEEKKE